MEKWDAPSLADGPSDGLDHKHWMLPLLVVLIGVFMSILSSSIVNVAIASIMSVFNTDTAGVQWVSTAYMLAMAWNLESLVAARVLQALGGGMFAALFYIPLFLQSIRGLGAMETGLIMLPAAIVAAVMMPVSGKLFDRFGPRAVIVVGLCGMALVTWMLAGITLDTSTVTVMAWLRWRGVAMGLCMMPAQTAALNDIPVALVSRASSVSNLIRNVASSFGIAIMTVLLNDRSVFHKARMTETISTDNVAFAGWQASNPSLGGSLVSGRITQQAYVLSIQDVFLLTTVITLLAIFPALFLKKAKSPPRRP